MAEAVAIDNAGLVILQGFFPQLFERLGLTLGGRFVSAHTRVHGVRVLELLAAGQDAKPEHELELNKLLCGLSRGESVDADIDISSADRAVCDQLMMAAIARWPNIGNSTVNAFRSNWIMRQGSLIENGDRWQLIVASRAYDILLAQCPLLTSTVKLPWMEKAIDISWRT